MSCSWRVQPLPFSGSPDLLPNSAQGQSAPSTHRHRWGRTTRPDGRRPTAPPGRGCPARSRPGRRDGPRGRTRGRSMRRESSRRAAGGWRVRQRLGGHPGEAPDGLGEPGRVRQRVDFHPVLLRRSATGHLLQLLGVAGPLHRDLGGRGLDLAEVVGRQLDVGRPEVLLQAVRASWCPGWGRSRASGRAARRGRSGPASPPSARRSRRAGRPGPDSPSGPRA